MFFKRKTRAVRSPDIIQSHRNMDFARNGRYIRFKFVHNALVNKKEQMAKTVVNEMKKKIDAEIAKGGLK